MINDEFEWDDEKAARNLLAHGIPFDAAREVFRDRFVLMRPDRRENYDEERYSALGMAEGRLIYVAYAMRGARIRVISVRLATPREKRSYHEEES
ncbi:MAG TPA: BrnT family toxin [Rhizomicrobium sp.]|jgi:hypothetical protein